MSFWIAFIKLAHSHTDLSLVFFPLSMPRIPKSAQNSWDVPNPYCKYCRFCIPRSKFTDGNLKGHVPICRFHTNASNRPTRIEPKKPGMIKSRGRFVTKARQMFEDVVVPRVNARLSEEETRILLDVHDGFDQVDCRIGGKASNRDLCIVPADPPEGEQFPEEIAHDGVTPPRPVEFLASNFMVMTKMRAMRGGYIERNKQGIKRCKTQVSSYGLPPDLVEEKRAELHDLIEKSILAKKRIKEERLMAGNARPQKKPRVAASHEGPCRCAILRELFPGMFRDEDETFGL